MSVPMFWILFVVLVEQLLFCELLKCWMAVAFPLRLLQSAGLFVEKLKTIVNIGCEFHVVKLSRL